ncbi:MAG: hypothetical protein RLZZ265_1573 [Verrucomicrobiota bacterium]|jgi:hypothetical protein
MSKFIIVALILVGIAVVLVACRKSSASLQVGGIYSTADGKGGYGVVKLLAHGDGICHVRIYKQKFPSRPTTVDVGSLSLGKPGDPDGFGMGHIPMREAGFLESQPVLITKTTVTPDELEGYKIWKESGGGVF